MIPRLAPGEPITPAKLNRVIDALNAVGSSSSNLLAERGPGGSKVATARRPRHFYAIIKESPDRPRDDNGEVPDGEYEWAQVWLNPDGEFEEVPGQGLASYYDVEVGLLYGPAYEINGDRKVPVGQVVRMRPDQPIMEPDILARDDEGELILDDEGNPIVEEHRRGFVRRYAFSPSAARVMRMVEVQPDEGKRFATANYMGVFDGKLCNIALPTEGEYPDVRDLPVGHSGKIWILVLRHTPETLTMVTYAPAGVVGNFSCGDLVEQDSSGAKGFFFEDNGVDTVWIHTNQESSPFDPDGLITLVGADENYIVPDTVSVPDWSIQEEKVNLLPSFTRFKGLEVGTLDFHGDERPLYVIDDEPTVRQFEIPADAADFVQDSDETWDLYFEARFVDQPDAPLARIYRASELDNDALSAHYPGIGRKAVGGHHGSVGWARWSPATKRWELLESDFKIVALGEAAEDIAVGDRGKVDIWWKDLSLFPAFGFKDSTHTLHKCFNFSYEKIINGEKVAVSYDRQENLWYIIDVQWPCMIVGSNDYTTVEPVGKIELDDDNSTYTFNQVYPFHISKTADGHMVLKVLGPDFLEVKDDAAASIYPCHRIRFMSADFIVTDDGGGECTIRLA